MALDFPNSPTVGQVFQSWQWDGTKWVSVGGGAASGLNNIGRNLVHNLYFNIQQRGTGLWTTNGAYTADRWKTYLSGDTASYQIFAQNDVGRSQIGDEASKFFFQCNFTGTSGSTAATQINQFIEGVQRLSGKTATLSFWAQAGVAGLRFGACPIQNFGTGGSPSAPVAVNGQSVTLTTVWARYNLTFTLPSISGKTLGSNGDDNTQLVFWYSGGSGNSVFSGNVPVQTGAINLWGVQLEIGSTMTPLEKIDPGEDLKRCQRFYQTGLFSLNGYGTTGTGASIASALVVVMRAAPTVTTAPNQQINVTSPTVTAVQTTMTTYASVTATGGFAWNGNFSASADL